MVIFLCEEMNQGLIDIIESGILIDSMNLVIKIITGNSIPVRTGNAYLKQYILFTGKFDYNTLDV